MTAEALHPGPSGRAMAPMPVGALGVLLAGVLIGALDIAIVGPALPAMQDSFGVDDRALSWVFSIFILFNVVGAPLLAKCSDRYGRRNLYVVSLTLFGAGSLVVATAPSFAALLGGRALQAFGAGGIFPVASAFVADTFPVERRGRVLGLIGAVFGVAFLLGPLLGGLLLRFGWQWLFLINLPFVALVIGFSLRVLPAGRTPRRSRFDFAGAVLLSVLLLSAAWAVNRIDMAALPAGVLARQVWPFLLLAAAAAPLLWHAERRASDPILPPALFDSLRLRAVGAIAVTVGLVEAGMVFLPALAVSAFRVEAAAASLMMLPLVAALIVGAPLAGWLLDRTGARPVIQVGLLLTAGGLAIFGVVPLSITSFYVAGLLVGSGLSALLGAPLRYVVLKEAGQSRLGAGQGALTLFLSAGQLVGAAVIGAVAASAENAAAGYATAFLPLAALCALALPLTLLLEPGPARSSELVVRDEAGPGS